MPIECAHANDVGRVGLGIDLYQSESRCADCVKLLRWERTWNQRRLARQAMAMQIGAEREQELSNPQTRLDKVRRK